MMGLDVARASRWGFWLAAAVVFLLLLFYLGRPVEPRTIEVDVTDKIAETTATRDGPRDER